jgi:hypothetical protein
MYTKEDIDTIRAMGQLDSYIEHAREHMAKLEAGVLVEEGDYVSYAGYGGDVGVLMDTRPYTVYARSYIGWEHRWPIDTFGANGDEATYVLATTHAKLELLNHLKDFAAKQLIEARIRITLLEEAADQ